MSASTEAGEYLEEAMTATDNLDVIGAAVAVDGAAESTEGAADATTADPAVSDPMYEAASLYRTAASQLRAYDIEGATASVNAATQKIEESTAAVNSTTVPYC